jgi:polyisoprenoid-binding protein YceI
MKKVLFSLLMLCFMMGSVQAQKYFTRSGKITFFSDAALEKIEAHNSTATSVIDLETGRVEFAALIKAFQFEKALMQEHFNENYMESDKFPKATFKGALADASKVNFKKDGTYNVTLKGSMTIHGVSKEIEVPGTFVIQNGKIKGTSTFNVRVADYNIEIPSVVVQNIADEVKVSVDMDYEIFTKS